MAIENLILAATDFEKRGGLRHIGLCATSNLTPTFADGTDAHSVALVDGSALALFDLKQGTGSLTTSGSKENGVMMFEHTLSFYIPNCTTAHFSNLQSLLQEQIAAVVVDHNDQAFVIGISAAFQHDTGSGAFNQQMYATMTGLEGGTGTALGDENGVTVTITCSSGELPRTVSSTVTVDIAGTMALS
mgnify:CR=1 FL=1